MRRALTILASLALTITGLFVTAPTASADVTGCGSQGTWQNGATWGRTSTVHINLSEGCANHYQGRLDDNLTDGWCVELKRKTTSGSWVTSGFVQQPFENYGNTSCGPVVNWGVVPGVLTCGFRLYRGDGSFYTVDNFNGGTNNAHGFSGSCP